MENADAKAYRLEYDIMMEGKPSPVRCLELLLKHKEYVHSQTGIDVECDGLQMTVSDIYEIAADIAEKAKFLITIPIRQQSVIPWMGSPYRRDYMKLL